MSHSTYDRPKFFQSQISQGLRPFIFLGVLFFLNLLELFVKLIFQLAALAISCAESHVPSFVEERLLTTFHYISSLGNYLRSKGFICHVSASEKEKTKRKAFLSAAASQAWQLSSAALAYPTTPSISGRQINSCKSFVLADSSRISSQLNASKAIRTQNLPHSFFLFHNKYFVWTKKYCVARLHLTLTLLHRFSNLLLSVSPNLRLK